jgi:hypothetical protein
VLDCTITSPYFKVEGLAGPAVAEYGLTIAVAAEAPAGIHSGRIVFTLDDPDQHNVIVEVMACLK